MIRTIKLGIRSSYYHTIPGEAKAKYGDGILSIRVPLKYPGKDVEIDEEN